MLKVGIIGAGRIGKVHITSISTRVKDASMMRRLHGQRAWAWSM